jgi:O-antigen ligase
VPLIFIVAWLALNRHPYTLLLAAIFTGALPNGAWSIAGVKLDPEDIVYAGLLFAIVGLGKGRGGGPWHRIPYFYTWLALGIWMSCAYLLAPVNQQYLTDPVRIVYQLYRYCWKTILIYPLAVLLIGNDDRRRAATVLAVVVTGAVISIHASIQGYGHHPDPCAYFKTGNSMGGVLITPLIFAFAAIFTAGTRRNFILALALTGLIVRGAIFANSRGAFVAMGAAFAAFCLLMMGDAVGRKAMLRFAGLGLAGVVGLFVVMPDLLQRPNISHILTAFAGTSDSNFQWRSQQRWGYFWEKILADPWFGIGTNVDLSLGDSANTPHNGYLSFAIIYGLPAATLLVILALRALRYGWRVRRLPSSPSSRIYVFATIASIFGLLVHNLVDSTIIISFAARLFWMLIAIAAITCRGARATALDPAALPSRPPRLPRTPVRRPLRPRLAGPMRPARHGPSLGD